MESENGMEDYVSKVINTSNKLAGIGFPIDDEWISAILLAGLTEKYNPFIMGVEANGNSLSKDTIVAKLLYSGNDDEKNSTFFGKQNKKRAARVSATIVIRHFTLQMGVTKRKKR